MYDMRIREVIFLSLEKKDHIHLTGIPSWRQNCMAIITARSSLVGFFVMTVIAGASRSVYMRINLPLCITVRAERGVTRYERGDDGAA